MSLSLKVQHYQRIPGTTQLRLTRVTPYVRLCRDDGPPLFVQGGQVYSESGDRMTDQLPEWFWDEAAKMSLAVRQEVGLVLPGEPPQPTTPAPAPSTAGDGRLPCEICGRQLLPRQRNFHRLAHERAAARRVEDAGRV